MNVDKVTDFLGKHWGEILFGIQVLSGLASKADEDAPPEVKKLSGILGKGDEIKFLKIIKSFPPEDREMLLGLLQYHFGSLESPRSWVKTLIAFVQINKWRTLVTDLDSPARKSGTQKTSFSVTVPLNPSQPTGKQRGKKDGNGVSYTNTIDKDILSGGSNDTSDFLKQIIGIVRTGENASEKSLAANKRKDGYNAAIEYMRSLGLPLMPKKETLEWIEKTIPDSFAKLKNWYSQQDFEAVHRQMVEERKERDGRLTSFLRRLLFQA